MFEQAFLEFCAFVRADKRMTFWVMGAKDYEWTADCKARKPRSNAATHLPKGKIRRAHQGLRGDQDRRGPPRYLCATQGRTRPRGGVKDVRLRLSLNLRRVRRRASAALYGEPTHQSWLFRHLRFAPRSDHNGKKIMSDRPADKYTVKEIDCDVRPRFRKRSGPV